MNSSDSMNGNNFYKRSPTSQEMPPSSSEHSSSAAAESSSDSGNTEKISTPLSTKQQKRSSPNKNRNNIPTPSKASSSIKRPREPQEKGASKRSSKKSKKPAQEDNKGEAAEVPEAEKSAKKGGPVWNSKDEAVFLKRLLTCCEKGKGLPKNLSFFYEAVKKDLDRDYSHDQLYNKFRGLKTKFRASRDKVKDKGLVGFKNPHEENLYRLSSQIWGNKEEEEGVGTEKAGKGGNARAVVKKKNVVVDPRREREEVNMNKNGDVDMALKEQEGDEDEDEYEDESDGEEEEGHDQCEQNVNLNLSQHDSLKATKTKKKKAERISPISESVLNRVEDTGTQRSKVEVGEDEGSSEDNGGEEKDSSGESDESEGESTDDENSALQNSNAALILSRSNAGGSATPRDANIALKQSNIRENSTPHVSNGGSKGSRGVSTTGHYDSGVGTAQELSDRRKVAAAVHHDARDNFSRPFQNGTSEGRRRIASTKLPNNEENLAQNAPSGITNGSPCVVTTEQYQMFDQLCKENMRIVNGQLQDMLDGFKNEIVNLVNTTKREVQRSSNTARATGFDFSLINGMTSGRELPSLSKTEAEMLDQKWQTQQFIEMEAASKHLALLQEEYQLRMAKFRHQ